MANPETHHEKSDVAVRPLLWFIVIFIVFAAAVHLLLYGLFRVYQHEFASEPHPPRTAMKVPPPVPQEPRLQPFPSKDARGADVSPNAATPVVDMAEMRANEQQALDNPGWIDKQHGVVRIPIERAKALAFQRGMFPVNTAGGAQ